jgi:predicted lipoprotein
MMNDAIAKLKGPPYSTSRKQEKAAKRNTCKARRQDDRRKAQEEFDRQFTEWRGDSNGSVGCD